MRRTMVVLPCAAFLLACAGDASAQCIANISTGYDEEAGAVLLEGDLDDDWTVDDGLTGPIPAYTGGAAQGFPVPPWVANDAESLWIAPTVNATANQGRYAYEIAVELDDAIADPKLMVLEGVLAADDGGGALFINGASANFTFGGFGTMTQIPTGLGFGLFQLGENTLRFEVDNGGPLANPAGFRLAACITAGQAESRPGDLSTGFDRAAVRILDDGANDAAYTVSGPGIGPIPAVVVNDDGPPFPQWLATSVQSRWIGPVADADGSAGEYIYEIEVDLPAGLAPADAVLLGGVAADDQVTDVYVNGTSTGFAATGFGALTSFPLNAGRGLFKTGKNTVELIVFNGESGTTGLRVDARIAEGPPLVEGPPSVGSIDTGFDGATGQTIPNLSPDDNWVMYGPPGSGIAEFATVVQDDIWPIQAGVWIGSTPQSKWIGTNQPTSNGPEGLYTFRIRVEVPAGVDAAELRIIGSWTSDNMAKDIIVNGVSTGLGASGNFTALEAFPQGAGLGLFQVGVNTLDFIVENAGPGAGPVGLRVEAVVGTGAVDPTDLSTGLGRRGTGVLPGGAEDPRYVVTGPSGSGIGPRPAIAVPEDGSPIPPWAAGSQRSRWIGLDGADSVGPAGTYTYDLAFDLPTQLNAYRVVIAGTWAAAGTGADVILNGTSLGITASGPGTLISFPDEAGLGHFQPGANTLRFVVENAAQGSTGLRVEANLGVVVVPDPLDISTGFDQETGLTLDNGSPDGDFVVEDPLGIEELATVLPDDAYPIVAGPWIASTPGSKWIGIAGAVAAAPGVYTFQKEVVLTAAEAEGAKIVGYWAVDDGSEGIRVNDQDIGVPAPAGGFAAATYFPPDAGLGFFREGLNVIQFLVTNGGEAANPSGLRVEAVIVPGGGGGKPEFLRSDSNADGSVNITDGIFVLNYLFLGGDTPPCLEAANANDDDSVNITDGIFILNFLFLGGADPPAPGPTSCGPDPAGSINDQGCESFDPC